MLCIDEYENIKVPNQTIVGGSVKKLFMPRL